jgi:hypothetical protein
MLCAPAATFEPSTSTKSIASRSDCRMRLAILVFVAAKNALSLLSIASALAFRAGLAVAGAKAQLCLSLYGTTKSRALIQSKNTKPNRFSSSSILRFDSENVESPCAFPKERRTRGFVRCSVAGNPGRDDKGEGSGFIESGCWTEVKTPRAMRSRSILPNNNST